VLFLRLKYRPVASVLLGFLRHGPLWPSAFVNKDDLWQLVGRFVGSTRRFIIR
jgi:hypothetical protein